MQAAHDRDPNSWFRTRGGRRFGIEFALIVIVWQGVRIMFSGRGLGEHLFEVARMLLFLSFG